MNACSLKVEILPKHPNLKRTRNSWSQVLVIYKNWNRTVNWWCYYVGNMKLQSALCIPWFCIHKSNQMGIGSICRKKIPVSSKEQNLLHTHNYLHNIYIVTICIAFILAIIINLELILSIQQDLYGLYADTAPFYLRDLSIGRFWYLWEGWYRSSAVHDAEITCAVTKIHDFNGRRRHRIKPRFH